MAGVLGRWFAHCRPLLSPRAEGAGKRSRGRVLLGPAVGFVMLLSGPGTALAVDEFPVPNPCAPAPAPDVGTCQPAGITTGPDGAIWFTEENGNRISRITTAGTVTNQFPLAAGSLPAEIVTGPDGRLWFTQSGRNKIGAITTGGAISEYPPGGTNLDAPADGITVGPDGALWFTEFATSGTSRVGRITTAGTVTEFSLPSGSEPGDITAGPDGRLWFTQAGTTATLNRVGAVDGAGNVSHYPSTGGLDDPSGITVSAGTLWFTEHGANQIRTIATNGALGPPTPVGAGPSSIATGADGALWFTETIANKIGRITPSGVLTNEFSVPTVNSQPGGITAGPDGALWFTEFVGNNIGRIATAPPFVPPPPPPPPLPAAGSKAAKKCKVPKLRRLTVKKAKRKLKRAGCRYRIRGKGRVVSTRPKAGRRTTKRVIVKLKRKSKSRKARRR